MRIELTMLRVATRILGGVILALTISLTKFAVMPMIAIKQATCRPLVILYVEPNAPLGPAILNECVAEGLAFE
jgi:hypothetical protein